MDTYNFCVKIRNSILHVHPFQHIVIDNFFDDDFANSLAISFPSYSSTFWRGEYNDALVIKKTCQEWSLFPSDFYKAFFLLVSRPTVDALSVKFELPDLQPDFGLHGGGMHTHANGGRLNIHLDYHTHYKVPSLMRNLNLIVYLNPNWDKGYGGELELWEHDIELNCPSYCAKIIEPQFNRAVIFNTAQNSWHGMPNAYNDPTGSQRNSIAAYYLSPNNFQSLRNRALFAPSELQKGDPEIERLIKERARNY